MKHWYRAVVALGLLALLSCAEPVKTAPDELVHTWHSKAAHMAGRYLEIRQDWVVFGSDSYSMKMYPLVRVEEETRSDGTHYTLYYQGDGNKERQLGVLYGTGTPRTLRLDNRDESWVRTQDASWLKEKTS